MLIANITYRPATHADLDAICKFVDFWLSGKAAEEGIDNAGKDYFIPRGRHKDYIKNYKVFLAMNDDELLGWGVMQRDGTLIHLLISGDYRGYGIGAHLVRILQPFAIRSKVDQSTGNPNKFYEHLGYTEHGTVLIGKHNNIDVLKKPTQHT